MIIRELLVALGVVADVKAVREYDDATADVKETMKEAGEAAATAAAEVTGLAEAERQAAEDATAQARAAEQTAAAVDDLTDRTRESEVQTRKARDETTSWSGELNNLAGAAAKVALSVGAMLAGIGLSIYSFAQAGSEAEKGAQRTAVSVETYQRLAFALGQADVSQEQMEAGLKMLNTRLQTAAGAGEAFIATASGMRLSIVDATGAILSQEQMVYRVADAVRGAETDQERLAIAVAAFGEEVGARMVPALAAGGAALEGLGRRADRFGVVIDEQTAKQGARWLDQLSELSAVLVGLRNVLGEIFLPVLIQSADTMLRLAETYGPFVRELLGSRTAIVLITGLVLGLTAALGAAGLVGTIAAAATAFGALFTPIGIVLTLVAAQIAFTIAQIAALALVLEDVYTYVTGGQSALGTFLEQWRGTEGVMGSLVRIFDAMVAVGRALWDVFGLIGSIVIDVFGGVGVPVLERMLSALASIATLAADVLVPALDRVAATIEAIASGVGAITSFAGGALGFDVGTNAAAQAAGAAVSQSVRQTTQSVTQQIAITLNGGDESLVQRIREELESANRQAGAVFAGAEV